MSEITVDPSRLKKANATVLREVITDVTELKTDALGLYQGLAGQLLYLVCQRESDSPRDLQRAIEVGIDRVLAGLESTSLDASFAGGISGIGWVLQFIINHDKECCLGRYDAGDLVEIDEALCAYVAPTPWKFDFDLVSGLVGIGIYALRRREFVSGQHLIAQVVHQLAASAVGDQQECAWRTPQPTLDRKLRLSGLQLDHLASIDLGLAHGVPGVIALLSKCVTSGVQTDVARPLLSRAVTWVLRRRLSSNALSSFSVSADRYDSSRVAWCYGDPGVALSLFLAARSLGDISLQNIASEIAVKSAGRRHSGHGIVDACYCHGSAGLAQLYRRMYQMSGDKCLSFASDHWLNETLKFGTGESADGGYAYPRSKGGRFHHMPSQALLEGIIGTGLVLSSPKNDDFGDWDEALLTS